MPQFLYLTGLLVLGELSKQIPPISLFFPRLNKCRSLTISCTVLQTSKQSPSSGYPMILLGKKTFTAPAFKAFSQSSKLQHSVQGHTHDTQLFYHSPISMVARSTGRWHHYIYNLIFMYFKIYAYTYICIFLYLYFSM